MASFNKAILMGNLTRDPELRFTQNGASVCNFDIAVNRNYTTQGGEKRDEVLYMAVVVWGKQGETCSQHLKKGRSVIIDGHLQQRSWETPEGQKRSKIELVAEHVQFLGGNDASSKSGEQPAEPAAVSEDVPF